MKASRSIPNREAVRAKFPDAGQLERALASAQREGMLKAAEMARYRMSGRSKMIDAGELIGSILFEADKLAAGGGSAKVPEGMVLVPIRDILDVIFHVESHTYRPVDWKKDVLDVLRRPLHGVKDQVDAMLAAAPSPGEEEQR